MVKTRKQEKAKKSFLQTVWKWMSKGWNYIWNGDSPLSWVLSLIFAFIFIKFFIYPALGVMFGTQFPIVAVVSNSMEHDGSFDEWWAIHEDFYLRNAITKEEFLTYPFSNGFNKGDIMILRGVDEDKVARGDVLVFWSGKPYPIIHRVTHVSVHEEDGARYYQTKGDHNLNQVRQPPILDETDIRTHQIVGKAVMRLPYLGYVKIVFVDAITAVVQMFK